MSDIPVLGAELRDIPTTPHERLHKPLLASRVDLLVQVRSHTTEALEVLLDERPRLVPSDAELSGQRKRSLPIERSEVDGLGRPALVPRHLVERHAEDDRSRLLVHIYSVPEGTHQRFIPREMGEDAQFDLRVVCPIEEAAVRRNESLADLAAQVSSDGDVLEVGFAGREPTRRRHRLIESGVDTARARDHELGQGVDIRGTELFELPVLEHEAGDVMPLAR